MVQRQSSTTAEEVARFPSVSSLIQAGDVRKNIRSPKPCFNIPGIGNRLFVAYLMLLRSSCLIQAIMDRIPDVFHTCVWCCGHEYINVVDDDDDNVTKNSCIPGVSEYRKLLSWTILGPAVQYMIWQEINFQWGVQESGTDGKDILCPSNQTNSLSMYLCRSNAEVHNTGMESVNGGDFEIELDLRPCPEEETGDNDKRCLILPSDQTYSHLTFIQNIQLSSNTQGTVEIEFNLRECPVHIWDYVSLVVKGLNIISRYICR